jgi:phage tail sheath protein FI
MPEYLSPGVYVEEIELGARPIEGVSTSTAGFLGVTLRGPQEPRLVTGFEEFKRLYGGYLPIDTSTLPFAVEGFFNNGGRRCFIGRIASQDSVHGAGNGAVTMTADIPLGGGAQAQVSAIGPGDWANRIAAKIESGSLGQPRFKLTVMYWDTAPPMPLVDPTDPLNIVNPNRREPTLLEVYDNLSADGSSLDFYETVINGSSSLIRMDHLPLGGAIPAPAPAVPALALGFLSALGVAGTPGAALGIGDFQGVSLPALPDGTVLRTGLLGFEEVDEISIVAAPDEHRTATLTTELVTHCTKMRYRFAVLGSRKADTPDNVPQPQDTTYSAFYFPWIKVFNPLINQDSLISAVGHVAGIYAATDINRGVFKSPANEVVVGATSLQFNITKSEQDGLNPRGINCLRIFTSRGLRVWGARTCSTNTLWKYINVRRFFLFLGKSIDEGTQWVVFENNDERLWARVKQTITQFLITQWRAGALMGLKQEDAFFVKVDRTTMTQDDIDNGRLIVIIGVAVVKPAEFVIFRLTQFPGGSSITV